MNQSTAQTIAAPLKVNGILFDLDGTMVDSVPDIHPATNRMLCDLGLPAVELSVVRTWIGNGAANLVHRALTNDHDGIADKALHRKALALYMEYYRQDVYRFSQPYDGVMDALENLSQRGFILGCVTNKPASHTLPLLQNISMAKYFRVVVSGDTCVNRKPDPQPLFYGCEQMGIDASQCLMVGDSKSDIMAGQAANMPVFCVTYGYNQGVDLAALAPDALIEDFANIPAMVEISN